MTADDAAEPAFLFTDMAGRLCALPPKATGGFSGSVLPEWCRPEASDLWFDRDAAACFGAARHLGFGWIKRTPHGPPVWFDTRAMLGRLVARLAAMGIEIRVGFEAEFYVFETAEIVAGLTGSRIALESADMPFQGDPSGSPYRIGYARMQFRPPPFDRHSGLRRQIVDQLAAGGVGVVHHDHEAGPGQQEIALAPAAPVTACDALSILKLFTHDIARRSGLTASFMPLPLAWCPGSGLHVHVSARRDGADMLFTRHGRTPEGRRVLQGLARAIPSLAAFTNPSPSGLRRLWMMTLALAGPPAAGYRSRRGLIRLIRPDAGRPGRIELRFPDLSGDPYAMLTVVLAAMLLQAPAPMAAPGFAPVLAMRPLLDAAVEALRPVLAAAGAHPRFAPAYLALRRQELDAMAMSASVAEMQLHLGC